MAKKRVCRGGVCSLQNLPKPKPKITSPAANNNNNLNTQPIYPTNRPFQAVQGLGQGMPQQYNQANSLNNAMAPLQGQQQNNVYQNLSPLMAQQRQYNPQDYLQGPMQGLTQGGWYNPYDQQQMPQQQYSQQQYAPQQGGQQLPNLPSLTPQNVAIPQGQVMHPTGKQRGSVGRFFSGTRPQVYNNPLYSPYQNDALNYLTQFGLGGIQNLQQNQPGNNFNFAPIGNQELERFYTQTVPSLAERFTALGDGQRSSAFQGTLAQAGRGLGNDLAAQQQQYNLQQQQLAQNQYGMNQNLYSNALSLGLRPQFESNLQPGKSGALPTIVNAGVKLATAFI